MSDEILGVTWFDPDQSVTVMLPNGRKGTWSGPADGEVMQPTNKAAKRYGLLYLVKGSWRTNDGSVRVRGDDNLLDGVKP